VPEVERVFGKAGRADTATDPAPLEMFETTIQFKPREQWRAGMTPDKLVQALDRPSRCRACPTSGCRPSATASTCWPPASRARWASRSPAPTWHHRQAGGQVEAVVKKFQESVGAGGAPGRRALRRHVDRPRGAARYGMNVADVQTIVSTAIGGDNVGEVVRGASAFPSTCATRARLRDSLERCATLSFVTDKGARLRLQDVASIKLEEGPPMLRSENARLSGWVYVDLRGRDLRSVVTRHAAARVAQEVSCRLATPSRGRAVRVPGARTERMKVVVPFTLASSSCCCT
jgi:Cu(I)/Ag(I) efflux system membrane protein CusA/SilA